jgi:hypothetical protein
MLPQHTTLGKREKLRCFHHCLEQDQGQHQIIAAAQSTLRRSDAIS